MKYINYVKFLFIIFVGLFFIEVKALNGCPSDEIKNLKELANNIEIKTSYDIVKNSDDIEYAQYSVQVINVNEDLKILYRDSSNSQFTKIEVSELESYKFEGGSKLEFKIYSYTANVCTNELLRTITVELPKYNYYYSENKEKCDKYPDFEYCAKFKNVKYSEFSKIDNLFDKYINNNTSIVDSIQNGNYTIYIILSLSIIIIIIVIVVIIRRKYRKKKLDF